MAAEFKIGRLRFTWQGPWTTNTTYIKDAIVSYQGKTYVCLIANTSNGTNFYNDLYYVTPSGSSTPLWNLIIDGKTFTGTWTSGTAYSLGNIAIFGGQIYYCNTNHTSTSFASQSTYWTLYTQFPNWHVSWTINTVYGIGDVDFAVFSIFDNKDNWPKADTLFGNKKIALFHGPVDNSTTDVGYVVSSRHFTTEIFDGYDK